MLIAFSLEPHELKSLVVESERAWHSLGQVSYGPSEAERKSLIFRRSIYVAEDIAEGDLLTTRNLRILRPGDGAPPNLLPFLIGHRAKCMLKKGTPLRLDSLLP